MSMPTKTGANMSPNPELNKSDEAELSGYRAYLEGVRLTIQQQGQGLKRAEVGSLFVI
jgi:hypothetical protein